MANTKGSALPHPTTVLPTDLALIVTDPGGTPQSQSISFANIVTSLSGTTGSTFAAGNDARITGAAQKSANLSDLASASAARTNLGLGTAATVAVSSLLQVANNLSDLLDAPTARTNLGLGAAATMAVGTTPGTVAAGDDPRFDEAARTADLGGAAFLDVGTIAGTVAAGDDSRIVNAQQFTFAAFSDANYAVQPTDRIVAQTGTLTAARTVTLPPASALNAGESITVVDVSGSVTTTNRISISASGSDTINGKASFNNIQGYEQTSFTSDGVSKWTRSGNHYGAIVLGDVNYTALAEDKVIAFGTTLTTTRTVTLPDVNNVPLGSSIVVLDANAAINSPNFITVQGTSGQTINGNATIQLNYPRAAHIFYNTGFSWKYDGGRMNRHLNLSDVESTSSARTNLSVDHISRVKLSYMGWLF